MRLLGIDTSTSIAGVGLYVDDEDVEARVFSRTWRSRHNHGRELMPAVLDVLNEARIDLRAITHIAVARGPGGFSAVRVGIATARGLADPRGLPLIGVPTHVIQALADSASPHRRVVSLIPAGRNQISFGIFTPPISGMKGEFEMGVCEMEEVEERFVDEDTALCGEGAAIFSPEAFEGGLEMFRSPRLLLEAARQIFSSEAVVDAPATPIYSRPPTITKSNRF